MREETLRRCANSLEYQKSRRQQFLLAIDKRKTRPQTLVRELSKAMVSAWVYEEKQVRKKIDCVVLPLVVGAYICTSIEIMSLLTSTIMCVAVLAAV